MNFIKCGVDPVDLNFALNKLGVLNQNCLVQTSGLTSKLLSLQGLHPHIGAVLKRYSADLLLQMWRVGLCSCSHGKPSLDPIDKLDRIWGTSPDK